MPYFCFSCGRLGHLELYCTTPGSRDDKGELPFGSKLRASDDAKKSPASDNSSREPKSHSKPTTKNSSTNKEPGQEVTSPMKNKQPPKRKDAPHQVYKPVAKPLLLTDGSLVDPVGDAGASIKDPTTASNDTEGDDFAREPKKKKPNQITRQRPRRGPASHNECFKLELPGAWEPRGSSGASQYREA